MSSFAWVPHGQQTETAYKGANIIAHLYEVTALIAKSFCRVISSGYLTKIRIRLFVVSHPLGLIHRIRIFGIACPSDFFD